MTRLSKPAEPTAQPPRDPRADQYPMPRVPYGWYGVLRTAELRAGAIEQLHYFGKDLIAFRDGDGQATVLDAFCPHYGAHLGVGGKLVNGAIECPFHGWRFGADGRCVHAPFAKSPPRVGVGCYTVREHSGLIFVHVGDDPPTWEVPPIPEATSPRFGRPLLRSYRARTHIQEMRENIVDESHFHHIHGQAQPLRIWFHEDGPFARVESKLAKRLGGVLFDTEVRAQMYGPGVMVVRVEERFFRLAAIALTTPVDDETSELRMIYLIERPRYAPFLHPLLRELFRMTTDGEVDSEIAIWDRKVFSERPVFLRHETGIRALRRWYAQFYPSAATEEGVEAATSSEVVRSAGFR